MIRRPLWPVFLRGSTCSGTKRAPLPGVLLCVQLIRYIEGTPRLGSYSVDWHVSHLEAPLPPPPQAGVLVCRSAHQALKGALWVGSYSVVQCVRCLMGQPLYCLAADMLAYRGREAMVMAPPHMRDSAVSPCFHGCLAFLHWHFPP